MNLLMQNKSMEMFGLTFALISAIIAVIITWKLADYFISNRERNRLSRAQILRKKINWCVFWFLFVIMTISYFFIHK